MIYLQRLSQIKEYLKLLKKIIDDGSDEPNDRTGVGTRNLFGYQMRFDLSKGFPLVTTKKLHFKSIVHELLWFLKGDTNVQYLNSHGVSIWDEWAGTNGDLGPIYGKQWRDWNGIDQIKNVVNLLRSDPNSRRAVVSAWNVDDLDKMALPPCHCLFQFYVLNDRLSCQLYQRSADVFLGVPFNIASYALLTHIIASHTGYGVGDFIWTGGVVHLYKNHIEQAGIQLTRIPKDPPSLKLNRKPGWDYVYEDFVVVDYHPYPTIKAPIAV